MEQDIKNAFYGFAVGDALGVPVEFMSRERIAKDPVTDMREYGTHNQPKGTWSDDSSMAFCLAESLCKGYDLNDIAQNFIKWYRQNYWTPHGYVFDIGIATSKAINRLEKGTSPLLAGGMDEYSNGNGSLMRILPLIFYSKDQTIARRYELVAEVSSITHMHFRSILACFIYTELAIILLTEKNKTTAYTQMQITINDFLSDRQFNPKEVSFFDNILKGSIQHIEKDEIESSGYVVHTLEASLWCLMTTDSYTQAVLEAVNLGKDTDTTGCVTGGLAGILYGVDKEDGIPKEWIEMLARKSDIDDLIMRLNQKIS